VAATIHFTIILRRLYDEKVEAKYCEDKKKMFNQKFLALLVLTFVLQISHVLSQFPDQSLTPDFRHQVSIRIKAQDDVLYGSGHICSGVLISTFTVLTAASCLLKSDSEFYDASELTVAMGNYDRFLRIDQLTFDSPVLGVKIHGRFSRKTFANNLAVLEVESVQFTITVIPRMTSNEKITDGLSCYVYGWRDPSSGELTNGFVRSNVTTQLKNVCDRHENDFPPVTFCSSPTIDATENLDTCVGEVGTGLICGDELRGIISKSCNGDSATQYTDVSQLFNWIVMAHLNETMKLIESDLVRHIVFSALDFITYYANKPKLADDFEVLKYFF